MTTNIGTKAKRGMLCCIGTKRAIYGVKSYAPTHHTEEFYLARVESATREGLVKTAHSLVGRSIYDRARAYTIHSVILAPTATKTDIEALTAALEAKGYPDTFETREAARDFILSVCPHLKPENPPETARQTFDEWTADRALKAITEQPQ